MLGQAEWILIVTSISLVAAAAMGVNLTLAVWHGRSPRPVPVTTWLGIMILSASVLWTRGEGEEAETIVAAAATAVPTCPSTTSLHVDRSSRGRLVGSWSGAARCHVWALIEDPRTGVLWLQGPAWFGDESWTLELVLADDPTGGAQDYVVSIAVVEDEVHAAWLDRVRALDGVVMVPAATATAWVARDLAI